MYGAQYVLVDQALRGVGMRSTECPSSSLCVSFHLHGSQHPAIYKYGAKMDLLHYLTTIRSKPISLLLILRKVMEPIIAVHIKSFLFSKGLISDHQLRFRPVHSTLDMLILFSQQWMEAPNL